MWSKPGAYPRLGGERLKTKSCFRHGVHSNPEPKIKTDHSTSRDILTVPNFPGCSRPPGGCRPLQNHGGGFWGAVAPQLKGVCGARGPIWDTSQRTATMISPELLFASPPCYTWSLCKDAHIAHSKKARKPRTQQIVALEIKIAYFNLPT